MRFATQAYFETDWHRLKPEHKDQFRTIVREKFNPACDAWAGAQEAGTQYIWSKSLRVCAIVNGAGIMEMTTSFASPDGRATLHFARDDGNWVCYWRRIGDRGVYKIP